MSTPAEPTRTALPAPLAPFANRVYAVVWTATVVANIGAWMYTAAAGWLMTSLTSNALLVSLVQVADSVPMLLLAVPAGALADIIDRRWLLIVTEAGIAIVSSLFAAVIWLNWESPGILLFFMFLIGAGAAVTAPSWQSIVPSLVHKQDLPAAISANSVGVNISRAIGPALGGVLISAWGIAAPFWINGVSNLGTIGALLWWQPPHKAANRLPSENFLGAIGTGLRHARFNRPLLETLARALAFFPFASSYWALLPLVSRTRISGGPEIYGILLGAIGIGAVGGAFFTHAMTVRLGADRLVAVGTVATAVAISLYALASEPWLAIAASLLAGVAWISVLASLNVSAQVALPNWVRGRGLAIYVAVMFGGLALGSLVWGEMADLVGLPVALAASAACCLIGIPATRRWKLQTGAALDFMPSMHWPSPITALDVKGDHGPVLITVEYRVAAAARARFLRGIRKVSRERRRDGAYEWGLFEDVAQPGRFLETFLFESWVEHLRQHQRVTNADRVLETKVTGLLESPPVVTHLVAPDERGEAAPE